MTMENNANNRAPKDVASTSRRKNRCKSTKEIAPRRPKGRRSSKRTRINVIDPSGCDSSTSSRSEPGVQDKRQRPPREDNNEMENNVDDQDGHFCQSGHDDDNDNDNDEDATSEEDENIDPTGRGGKSDGRHHLHESPVDKNRAGDTNSGARALLRQPFPAVELARATGKRKHHPDRKQHVTDRIQMYVKAHIFRKVKFVQNEKMLMDVMVAVEKTEKFRDQRSREAFKSVYKGVVMEAINVRQSACDQAGYKIVCQYLSSHVFDDGCGNESLIPDDLQFFSLDTICKLRQATTADEVNAFKWFFGEFVECVSGKRVWSRHKYHDLISEAVNWDTGVQIVTVSDEAFALLLLDNYIEKWKVKFVAKLQGKGLEKRIDGKYTAATRGNFVFGGWSRAGQKKFNYYVNKVKEDRASPGAGDMEQEFLLHMQQTPTGKKIQERLQLRMTLAERRGNQDSGDESECEIYVEPL